MTIDLNACFRMVASRKSGPDPLGSGDSGSESQLQKDALFDRGRFASLTDSLSRSFANLHPSEPVAVALSGGTDSAALALIASDLCKSESRPLYFFHIHHGLFAQADDWLRRIEMLSTHLSGQLIVTHVKVQADTGKGIEAAARQARYQALSAMAAEHGLKAILLAHHRLDQAETVLFRLLRGAGVQGLVAMRSESQREGLLLLRPWLDVERVELLALMSDFSGRTGWEPVADPSNTDPQYARGALRRNVLPAIQEHWPAWQQTLVRHARQAAEAVEIMDEVAAMDLAGLDPDPQNRSFCLKSWRLLSPARQALVLRYWLGKQGASMPGDRRLTELLRQLRQLHQLGSDRDLQWQLDPYIVRCRQGRVLLDTK